jgi:hypothetical protein
VLVPAQSAHTRSTYALHAMRTPLQALPLNTTAEQLSATLATTAQTSAEQYCAAVVDDAKC